MEKSPPTDRLSPSERSRLMSRVRGKGNVRTELAFIQLLRKHRLTGWRRGYPLFGKPDFVFPKYRVAVFVDGEFRLGHPTLYQAPKANISFWEAKLERNRKRDGEVNARLQEKGWHVVRIWQHELKSDAWLAKLRACHAFDSILGGATDAVTHP
jgi:DNA mismatch endonuclease (patch repair protein)